MTDTCKHVPARPDADLTLCWKCGVEIVCAETEDRKHRGDTEWTTVKLWRPLTETEKLVKYDTIRKIRNLFVSLHQAEFGRILFEWLHVMDTPAIRLAESIMGRWIIVNGQHEDLAWSGSRWVDHDNGLPVGGVQISNFATREEAAEYAKEQFPGRSIMMP